MLTPGKSLRLRRLFRHSRTVIIPIDHPMFGGPVKGLENPIELMRLIARTQADGVLVSPWAIPRLAEVAGDLVIGARLDGGCSRLGPRVDDMRIVTGVEQALRFGAEAIALNVFVGGENEAEMLQKLGQTAQVCDDWGMPLIAEMIPSTALRHHFDKGDEQTSHNDLDDPVAIVSRMGAEYGGDVIKTIYRGNQEEFASVVQTATAPVIVAGGPKTGSDDEFLRMVKTCMDAGAAGICIGRNIWQRSQVQGIIAALCAIVHEDACVEDAARLL